MDNVLQYQGQIYTPQNFDRPSKSNSFYKRRLSHEQHNATKMVCNKKKNAF